ncbi:hypothetical protein B0H34DRAFT_297592 [Crassisporium funariophilum]|nr:hypothetical protein B0H34DRAFT_297592 [Crassisporium funariophilum]
MMPRMSMSMTVSSLFPFLNDFFSLYDHVSFSSRFSFFVQNNTQSIFLSLSLVYSLSLCSRLPLFLFYSCILVSFQRHRSMIHHPFIPSIIHHSIPFPFLSLIPFLAHHFESNLLFHFHFLINHPAAIESLAFFYSYSQVTVSSVYSIVYRFIVFIVLRLSTLIWCRLLGVSLHIVVVLAMHILFLMECTLSLSIILPGGW